MALTYTQITAITEKLYIPKMIEQIYNESAILSRMMKSQYFKLKTGGTSIMAPLVSSKPSVGGYYSDLDELDTTATDNITAASYDWKQIYEPVRISRLDILKNSGDAQKLSLIESKMMIAEMNIRENLSLGLYSDGTAATGALTTKQLTGFALILSTASTLGGIAVADLAEWIATVKANGGTNRALSLNLMQQTDNAARYGSGKPTMLTCDKDVYDQIWALYQPHQRIFNSEMGKLGFTDVLEFNGKPIIPDEHASANQLLFIDEKNTYLCAHRDENMRVETLERLETSNSMLSRIFWMGNLVCHSRRTNGLLDDIEVAS